MNEDQNNGYDFDEKEAHEWPEPPEARPRVFDPKKYLTKLPAREWTGQKDGQGKKIYRDTFSWYLEVKWRLLWLRTEHPDAEIETDAVVRADDEVWFKATVVIPHAIDATSGQIIGGGGKATGWARVGEFRASDGSNAYVERCETKAQGRALAALGYGTQFCGDELEEDGIVDAPVRSASANGHSGPQEAPHGSDPNLRPNAPANGHSANQGGGSSQGGRSGVSPQNADLKPTSNQIGAIYSIAKQTQDWDRIVVDRICVSLYGVIPENLKRAEASQLIDALKAGTVRLAQ